MAKTKDVYVCRECGYETVKWFGKCPSCSEFDSFELVTPMATANPKVQNKKALSVSHISDIYSEEELNEIDAILANR